jgi:hypothetical protein
MGFQRILSSSFITKSQPSIIFLSNYIFPALEATCIFPKTVLTFGNPYDQMYKDNNKDRALLSFYNSSII